MNLEDILEPESAVHVADIGAAMINETPPYKSLLERGLARLSAVDADERQRDKLARAYGDRTALYTEAIGDGGRHTLYLTSPESGMSSLLKPAKKSLEFFNGFPGFGTVEKEVAVQTRRLDDIPALQEIDFLKMDVQGSELNVLQHGRKALEECVAIQLEVSFITLYENQPAFGDIDLWMRANGFVPHCFTAVKRWSIVPTTRDNNFRLPFNQLLEADVVYVRDSIDPGGLSDRALKNLALIAFYAYSSIDLSVHLLIELETRNRIASGIHQKFLASLNTARHR